MDSNILATTIFEEAWLGNLSVISNTTEEILTEDYKEERYISYHLAQPTHKWLKAKILWGSSILGDLDAFSNRIADALLCIDPNMLICLNRICIISAAEDVEPICTAMGADPEEFPECIDSEESEILGCKWHAQNSIILNAAAIVKAAHQLVAIDPSFFQLKDEIATGFWMTLFHEIRHLGLECNPFLPEDEYPTALQSEAEVEQWATEQRIFPNS